MADKAQTPDRIETLAHVRAMYPQYQDMPDLELGNALAAKYPQYEFLKAEVPRGEGDKMMGPSTPESTQAALLNPGQPKPLTTAQRIGNAVLPPLVTAPTIAAGGELLQAAPWAGRALTSGALGGAKAISEGKGPGGVAWDTVVDTLLGAVTEGAGKLASAVKVPKLGWTTSLAEKAGKIEGAAAGRAGAGAVAEKTAVEVAKQLPANLMVDVPRLSRTGPIPLMEAVKKLNKLDDPAFSVARRELVDALNAVDKAQLGPAANKAPFAGQIFNKFAPKERFTYRGTKAERALGSDLATAAGKGARAAADSEGRAESVQPGYPNLTVPLLMLPEGLGFSELARHARPSL
jgi:hypothetical protein